MCISALGISTLGCMEVQAFNTGEPSLGGFLLPSKLIVIGTSSAYLALVPCLVCTANSCAIQKLLSIEAIFLNPLFQLLHADIFATFLLSLCQLQGPMQPPPWSFK